MSEKRELRSKNSKGKIKHSFEQCSEKCVRQEKSVCRRDKAKVMQDCLIMENVNPLNVPIMCGWERRKSESIIYYVAPCRLRFYDLQQISDYLYKTKSILSIEQFNLGFSLQINRPQPSITPLKQVADVTDGCENVAVPLVDELQKTSKRPSFSYINTRVFSEKIRVDNEFSSCCDCTDNCRDASNCSCIQLTINETKLIKATQEYLKRTKGYQFKRLLTLHPSGMFECNKRCKCNAKCANRVVQNGIKLRLQVFKTPNKGWGIRCLDDIPKGTFICTYSGEIHTEEAMEEIARKHGDEYVAELDYIQEIEKFIGTLEKERLKDGYESDIDGLIESDESYLSSSSNISSDIVDEDSDSNDSREKRRLVSQTTVSNKRMKCDTSSKESENEPEYVPLSKYLGEDVYLINAKMRGNIGRFLNHSCDPNCKIQSIFIDNHDPRFPVLAFFAIKQIAAFTELTWNYSYMSLPETKKYRCECGAKTCDQRILF